MKFYFKARKMIGVRVFSTSHESSKLKKSGPKRGYWRKIRQGKGGHGKIGQTEDSHCSLGGGS